MWSVWSVSFIWFVWFVLLSLVEPDQLDELNIPDEPDGPNTKRTAFLSILPGIFPLSQTRGPLDFRRAGIVFSQPTSPPPSSLFYSFPHPCDSFPKTWTLQTAYTAHVE
jgi:hypothetical protein